MRRTDRLYDLIQTLRDGRLHRATDLARAKGVSLRTIWRDMTTLMQSGLPIEGERGVGYILRVPLTLPPLMITAPELQALRTGLGLVAAGTDSAQAKAARTLAGKIAAVTPKPPKADGLNDAPNPKSSARPKSIPLLRRAIRARHKVSLSCLEANNILRHFDARPLYLDLKGTIWTLTAYDEGARQFAVIRLDRIIDATALADVFAREDGCELTDFRALSLA
jgi:predicted DNA-binding transcriptional regulator YafY